MCACVCVRRAELRGEVGSFQLWKMRKPGLVCLQITVERSQTYRENVHMWKQS